MNKFSFQKALLKCPIFFPSHFSPLISQPEARQDIEESLDQGSKGSRHESEALQSPDNRSLPHCDE